MGELQGVTADGLISPGAHPGVRLLAAVVMAGAPKMVELGSSILSRETGPSVGRRERKLFSSRTVGLQDDNRQRQAQELRCKNRAEPGAVALLEHFHSHIQILFSRRCYT